MGYSFHAALAVALAVLGYAMIAVADGLSKYVQEDISFVQVVFLRQLFQFVLMGLIWRIFFAHKHKFVIPPLRSQQFARNLLMLTIIPIYMSSLNYLDIGIAISLLNTAPLFALPFSVWLLREHITPMTLITLCIGFVGVLMIIQPGFDNFHPAMLMVLLAAALVGLYMVVSRKLAQDIHPINFLCYQSVVVVIPFAFLTAVFWQPISSDLWGKLLLVGLLGSGFHLFFLIAVRNLEANVIAPLMYVEVITGLLFGHWLFGTIPNDIALMGIATISIAGLMLTISKTRMIKRRNAPH